MKKIIENGESFFVFSRLETYTILDCLRETFEALSDWEFGTRTVLTFDEFIDFEKNLRSLVFPDSKNNMSE